MNKNLKLWIAQSESWHDFVNYMLPEESMAKYNFLSRPDDLYIALIGRLFEVFAGTELDKTELLSIAKGLEIYSLDKTKNNFKGVNYSDNMLISSSLYYLADYPSSACILANLFPVSDYETDIDKFISCFLRKDLNLEDNEYIYLFKEFLKSGDGHILDTLLESIFTSRREAYKNDPIGYLSFMLVEELLSKFKTNNIWYDLLTKSSSNQAYWKKYIEVNLKKKPPMWEFFPSQKEALTKNILMDDSTISLQMPTSSGKTAICELVIYNTVKSHPGRKVLFLAPFRALASELKKGFGRSLARLGIKSKTIYGGNIATQEEQSAIEKIDLLIATPEKFMAIENLLPNVYDMFTTIICDEGHLLDSKQRGLSYELLLARFKNNEIEGRQFIFLSAIIPNIALINDWLGGNAESLVESHYRPTEINFAFLKNPSQDNRTYLLEVNPTKEFPEKYVLNNFLVQDDFKFINQKTGRKNTYGYDSFKARSISVALKSVVSGSVAVFTPHKNGARGVVSYSKEVIAQLDTGLPLPNPVDFSNRERVEKLRSYFEAMFGTSYLLTRLVKYGALYHHGDLPQSVREVIEDSLKNEDIKLVICTNTLAEGVNLPIRTLIVSSTVRYNPFTKRNNLKIPVRDLKNLVGRTGRAGKETKGVVILVNPSDFSSITDVIENEGSEPVNGYLYTLIKGIHSIVIEERLTLSNDLLESQGEFFKQWIDSIDSSLISLLGEEVNVNELEELVQSLIKSTLAYRQLDENELGTLNSIVKLREGRLKEKLETSDFKLLKRSGAALRLYDLVVESVDFKNSLWVDTQDPLSIEWIDYIISTILELPQIKYQLEIEAESGINIDKDMIKVVVHMWLSGSWYKDIADELDITIEKVLGLFSSFIGFHIQNISSNIVRIVEGKLLEEEISISESVLNWPEFLLYGLNKVSQLHLIELGFVDRIGILAISEWIDSENFEYDAIGELRDYIINNSDHLLSYIEETVPHISHEKVRQNIGFLKIENIF